MSEVKFAVFVDVELPPELTQSHPILAVLQMFYKSNMAFEREITEFRRVDCNEPSP